MVGVEQQASLRFIRSLFKKGNVAIDLWQNDRGDLFIQLPLTLPKCSVIFQTNDALLIHFFGNDCSLQQLYDNALSPFVFLYHQQVFTCMYQPDADFEIYGAHQYFSDLKKMVACN